jgi:hydroxymethylpyrimidine/phosphomethylpyrimidine kinase
MPAQLVIDQVRAVLEDIPPRAAKTGALGNVEIVEALAEMAASFKFPLIVDPVMVSKHGAPLIAPEARDAIARKLLPCAFLVTPNLEEAAVLTGIEIRDVSAMREAAKRLCEAGAKAALVKGGHLDGSATDVLFTQGEWHEFTAPRIKTRHTHGTGCTYSAAIVAGLARGENLQVAIAHAKAFVTEAIRTAPGLGQGSGPLNFHAKGTARA